MKLYAPILVAMLAVPAFAQTDSTDSTKPEDTLSLRTGTAFYTDDSNMTMRSAEEIQTNWTTMSAEDQAAVRATCENLPAPATELQPSKGAGDATSTNDSSGTTTAEDMGYMADPVRMQAVCDATAAVFPDLLQRTRHTTGFEALGARMIWQWDQGLKRLRDRAQVSVPALIDKALAEGVPAPPAVQAVKERIGESPLLGKRGNRAARTRT